jgi:hypothetical protein
MPGQLKVFAMPKPAAGANDAIQGPQIDRAHGRHATARSQAAVTDHSSSGDSHSVHALRLHRPGFQRKLP